MSSDIKAAIKLICDEKGISYESVLETIKAALAAAYRKDFGNKLQNIQVEFDPETMKLEVFDVKTVVEDLPEEAVITEEVDEKPVMPTPTILKTETSASIEAATLEGEGPGEEKKRFNPKLELQIKDAKLIKKSAKVGDTITTKLEVAGEFGRMAAQTAKQVIIQKLREAERETVFNEFKDKERTILVGTVQRREGRMILVDLGKTVGLMPPDEQVGREAYIPGEHLKVYIVSVSKTTRGPEIIVSRAHAGIVEKFFEMEIPEIANGTVQIKGIAREAGSRTKISVWTDKENIDPIGSCIGQRGARVQTIISELHGEKIDIILYSEIPEEYITHALSPSKISDITLNQETKTALVNVPEDQLSLAIGKSGQNVRLAAKLTGWKIDIATATGEKAMTDEAAAAPESETPPANMEAVEKPSEPVEQTTETPAEEKAEPAEKTKKPRNEKTKMKKKKKE